MRINHLPKQALIGIAVVRIQHRLRAAAGNLTLQRYSAAKGVTGLPRYIDTSRNNDRNSLLSMTR